MAGLTSINKYEKTNGLDGSPTDYVEVGRVEDLLCTLKRCEKSLTNNSSQAK